MLRFVRIKIGIQIQIELRILIQVQIHNNNHLRENNTYTEHLVWRLGETRYSGKDRQESDNQFAINLLKSSCTRKNGIVHLRLKDNSVGLLNLGANHNKVHTSCPNSDLHAIEALYPRYHIS